MGVGALPRRGRVGFVLDHTEVLTWRHLNVFQHRCEIICRLPRGKCRQTDAESESLLHHTHGLRVAV